MLAPTPAKHTGQTLKEGIERVVTGIKRAVEDYDGSTQLLIEISAGAGQVLGDTFDEVGEMVHGVQNLNGFGGVCFDTCHAFASGYDYRTPEGTENVLQQFDEQVGLEHLKLTHVNDSKMDLNSKMDRHQHIGEGFAGEEGLKNILTSKPFSRIDWILETKPEKRLQDIAKLKAIRTQKT
ncbi:MAG: deoxyribonuclease IV [Candidatus Yanofskybacteria bacterium]|nr:deoxyribonuclease IV [Candidatus Yanofskybacteria bacterium]